MRGRPQNGAPDLAAIRTEVKAVYAELEARPHDRQCIARTRCCRFQITGKQPSLTAAEALVLIDGLRASGRRDAPERPDGACPLLDPQTSRCIAYEARPFGCRTHFCEAAGGVLPRREILDLIRRLEAAGTALSGDWPKGILAALAALEHRSRR